MSSIRGFLVFLLFGLALALGCWLFVRSWANVGASFQ
jgi:hypothetical protein